MALNKELLQLDIVVNGNQSLKALNELDKEAYNLRQELKGLKKGTEEYAATAKRLKEVEAAQAKLRAEIGLTALSLKQLVAESKRLTQIKNHLTPGTQEFRKIDGELQKVNARIKELRGNSATVGLSFNKMADGFNKYFGMFATFAAGLTGIMLSFRKVINTAQEFEKSMANVYTLLSAEDMNLYAETLKEGSLQIIKDYGFEIENTNKAMFDAISAGIPAGEAIQFLNQSARLAIGGVTDLGTATNGLTTIINAYNLDASEASDVADAFFSAQKYGKTTVEELAASIGKVAPIASTLGVSYQELLSATAQVTLSGISTSEAVNGLKAAMSNLVKPSKEAEEVMRAYGVPVGLSEVKAAGFTETLAKLNEVIQKNPDEIAKAIPSVEALNAVTALSGAKFENYAEILQQVNTDIGTTSSLSRAFAVQQETDAQKLARAKGELTAMSAEFGKKLQPALIWSTNLFKDFLKFIMENETAVKNLAKIVAVAATAFISYNVTIKAVTLAKQLAAKATALYEVALGFATKGMKAFNTVSKANIIGAIVTVVMAAVTAFSLFKDKLSGTTKAQKALNEAQKEITSRMAEEVAKMETLKVQLKSANQGTDQRRQIIEKLNQQYGQYLPSLLTEQMSNDEIAKSLAIVNGELEKKIKYQIYEEKYTEAMRKKIELEESYNKVLEIQNGYAEQRSLLGKASDKMQGIDFEKIAKNGAKELKAVTDEVAALEAKMNESLLQSNTVKVEETIAEGSTKVIEGVLHIYKSGEWVPVETNKEDPGGTKTDTSKEELKRQELLDNLTKMEEEYRLSKLEGNQKEIQAVKNKYAEMLSEVKAGSDEERRLLELQKAEITDLENKHIEQQKQRRHEVLKSYGLIVEADERDAALEELKGFYEEKLLTDEEYRLLKKEIEAEWALEDAIEKQELDLLNAETEEQEFQAEMALAKLRYDQQLAAAKDNALKKKQAEVDYHNAVKKLEDDDMKRKIANQVKEKEITLAKLEILQNASNLIGSLAKKNSALAKAMFVVEKAAAIAQGWVNIAKANLEMIAKSPETAGQPWVALNTAAGVVQIGNIVKQTVEGFSTNQYAKGRYTVTGKDDGRVYNAPYIGTVESSGIVKGPALISERGDEMIITGPHTRFLQANFPEIISLIHATRRVPQHAEGVYPDINTTVSGTMSNQELINTLNTMMMVLGSLQSAIGNIRAYISYDDITDAQTEVEEIKNDVTY